MPTENEYTEESFRAALDEFREKVGPLMDKVHDPAVKAEMIKRALAWAEKHARLTAA